MRRISLQTRAARVSGFFSFYEDAIFNALVDGGTTHHVTFAPNYVSDRPYSTTPGHIEEIIRRLPKEFRSIYEQSRTRENTDALSVDYYELDFLDFLWNQKSNRVLRLVGGVGVGKTTFLNYVFRHLRPACAAFARFLPIQVNFNRYPTADLEKGDLAEMMWRGIETSLQAELESGSGVAPDTIIPLIQQLNDYGIKRARDDGLYRLIQFVREIFPVSDECEPIFIFDNVDHLDSESVAQISHFSRALFLETRCCVVIAMRPPALATHIETDAHKGAFYTFRIILPPPNLKMILSRRLKQIVKAGYISYEVGGTQLSVRIDDVESAVRNIVNNVLDGDSQRLILVGVANNNVRKAALAFSKFLMWSGLRPDLMVANPTGDQKNLPGGFREHLLRGVMLGSSDYFCDTPEDRPVISNILQFTSPGFAPDHLIQHRVLTLLAWARKTISVDSLMDWLHACGYRPDHIRLCLEHMLRRALVYSPETEDSFERLRNITLSESGAYYLSEFLADPEYILEAIPDVELRHEGFVGSQRGFAARVHSILELLERVEREEKRQLLNVTQTSHAAQVLGALYRSGLFQRRLIDAARRLTRSMFRSEHDTVRQAASDLDDILTRAIERTENAERVLAEYTIGANLILQPAKRTFEVFRRRWGQDYRLELRVPTILAPGDANEIEIECVLGPGEQAELLYGRLQSLNGLVDEMAELRRQGRTHLFNGSFTIPWRGDIVRLDTLRLSLFADSRPILQCLVGGSQANQEAAE